MNDNNNHKLYNEPLIYLKLLTILHSDINFIPL